MTSDMRTALLLDGAFGALLLWVGVALLRDPRRVEAVISRAFRTSSPFAESQAKDWAARATGGVMSVAGLWSLGKAVAAAAGLL